MNVKNSQGAADIHPFMGSKSTGTNRSTNSPLPSFEVLTFARVSSPPESLNYLSVEPQTPNTAHGGGKLIKLALGKESASIPSERVILGLEHIAMGQHQTQNFSQDEIDKVREWNNSQIDDRWNLKVGEVYTPSGSLLYGGDPRWHQWVALASVDDEAKHYITKEQNIHLELQKMADNIERMKDIELREIMERERLAERQRVHTPPPDVERLIYFLRELDEGSEALPPGICEDESVVREWLYEHIFIEDEQPRPIYDKRANKFTRYRGEVTTFRTARENVLNDIEEIIRYIFSPAGEAIRKRLKARVIDQPATSSRSVDSLNTGSSKLSLRQPFAEQLTDIDTHNSSQNQSRSRGALTAELPIDQHYNVKPENSLEGATDRLGIDEVQIVDSLCIGAVNRTQSKHRVAGPGITSVTTPLLTTTATRLTTPITTSHANRALTTTTLSSAASRSTAALQQKTDDLNMVGSAQASHMLQTDAQQLPLGGNAQQTLFGATSQHFQFGVHPGSMYLNPPFASQMRHMAPMQQPWVFQQAAGTILQSNCSALHTMPQSYPWQSLYSQPTPGYQAYQQSTVGQHIYTPPLIPSGREVRPPAPGRMARISALPEAFHNHADMRGRDTPITPTHNTEWQNRYAAQPTFIPDVPTLPYRAGSDVMYPRPTGVASVRFQRLTRDVPPTLGVVAAEENLPFMETAKLSKPAAWGVMKIGNIPYDLSKEAILNFLGPHAKLITADLGPAVHIIMDRSTGKTMDCFVEFFSTPDARACINSILLRSISQNRIGDRVVDVMLSSQEELMTELFPKAKNVMWQGAKPLIQDSTELFNSGFKCFVSLEELGILVRHAEQPHRSSYTQRSPQRTYESLISLLAKFPWSDVAHYTVATRNSIFQATRSMLHILTINVRKLYNSPGSGSSSLISTYGAGYGGDWSGHNAWPVLTEALLKDVLMAALNAPGFSEKQRWELFEVSEYARTHFRVSPLLQYWPFEVLGRKPNVEEDVTELYAAIIANHPSNGQPGNARFGDFKHITERFDLESHTMEDAGNTECSILYLLLQGGLAGITG